MDCCQTTQSRGLGAASYMNCVILSLAGTVVQAAEVRHLVGGTLDGTTLGCRIAVSLATGFVLAVLLATKDEASGVY